MGLIYLSIAEKNNLSVSNISGAGLSKKTLQVNKLIKMMKTLVFIFLVLALTTTSSYAQKSIDIIDKYINEHCENCSQADLNKYILVLCEKSDSTLNNCINRFESKLSKGYNDKPAIKNIIRKNYNNSLIDLVAVRKKIMTRFVEMNGASTLNDYNRGLLYLSLTDNIISTLTFMEANLFEDFYIPPPIWGKVSD